MLTRPHYAKLKGGAGLSRRRFGTIGAAGLCGIVGMRESALADDLQEMNPLERRIFEMSREAGEELRLDPTREIGPGGVVRETQLEWVPGSQQFELAPNEHLAVQTHVPQFWLPNSQPVNFPVAAQHTVHVRSHAEAQALVRNAEQSGQYDQAILFATQSTPHGMRPLVSKNEVVPPMLVGFGDHNEFPEAEGYVLAEHFEEHHGELEAYVENYWDHFDPSGQMLARYKASEAVGNERLALSEADSSPFQLASFGGRHMGGRGCRMRRVNCGSGNAMAQMRYSNGQRYCRPVRSRQQSYGRNCYGANCNLPFGTGFKSMFDGSLLRNWAWQDPRWRRAPFLAKVGSVLFPRWGASRGYIGCHTARSILGRRTLAIIIGGIAIGAAAGGGGAAAAGGSAGGGAGGGGGGGAALAPIFLLEYDWELELLKQKLERNMIEWQELQMLEDQLKLADFAIRC